MCTMHKQSTINHHEINVRGVLTAGFFLKTTESRAQKTTQLNRIGRKTLKKVLNHKTQTHTHSHILTFSHSHILTQITFSHSTQHTAYSMQHAAQITKERDKTEGLQRTHHASPSQAPSIFSTYARSIFASAFAALFLKIGELSMCRCIGAYDEIMVGKEHL